ncbi:MAG: hypothetical protein CVU56_15990 [Deltaproteobacteria bacterium HGW-Deltaproteobacteria-14]|jgi:hypothetical protein|nr:MAG: hypothetical protein CVU56_15990 [Deltaproteobacteria bacterium HGW-Deltaproteobacteria-14]
MKSLVKAAHILAAGAALMLAACPSATTHEQPEPAAAAAKPTYPGPPKPWDTMELREKGQYMHDVVLPTMRRLFQEHDPANYADFSCETCHGLDAKERHFEMPNTELFALFPQGSPQQQQLVIERKPTLSFMFNTVLPAMQQLIGEPAYDPATKTGFSCFECHPHGVE